MKKRSIKQTVGLTAIGLCVWLAVNISTAHAGDIVWRVTIGTQDPGFSTRATFGNTVCRTVYYTPVIHRPSFAVRQVGRSWGPPPRHDERGPGYRHTSARGRRDDECGKRADCSHAGGNIIRHVSCDKRLMQPAVRGHIAFIQERRGHRGWVTVGQHPSIW